MLHTHDDFLNAITAQPGDRTLRLVYADWLDEQGDPRAALVRVEEEMSELPVSADRFWELKPRRNALRAQIGAEWCGRMCYGTECEPVFRHGIPDGWRERWRLIREFTERWHRVPMPDVGGRQKETAEAETQLGRKLPPSVREWVAFTHDVYEADYTGELRLACAQSVPGGQAISLWSTLDPYDSFGDSHEAVLHSDLDRPDPPVYSYLAEPDENAGVEFVRSGGRPEAESVTAFALNRAVTCTGPGGGSFCAAVDQLADLYRHLRRCFPSHVRCGECEWDEADNLLVEVEPAPAQRGVFFLTVRAAPAIRREQIPDFLWQYARLSGNRTGVFSSQESK